MPECDNPPAALDTTDGVPCTASCTDSASAASSLSSSSPVSLPTEPQSTSVAAINHTASTATEAVPLKSPSTTLPTPRSVPSPSNADISAKRPSPAPLNVNLPYRSLSLPMSASRSPSPGLRPHYGGTTPTEPSTAAQFADRFHAQAQQQDIEIVASYPNARVVKFRAPSVLASTSSISANDKKADAPLLAWRQTGERTLAAGEYQCLCKLVYDRLWLFFIVFTIYILHHTIGVYITARSVACFGWTSNSPMAESCEGARVRCPLFFVLLPVSCPPLLVSTTMRIP